MKWPWTKKKHDPDIDLLQKALSALIDLYHDKEPDLCFMRDNEAGRVLEAFATVIGVSFAAVGKVIGRDQAEFTRLMMDAFDNLDFQDLHSALAEAKN